MDRSWSSRADAGSARSDGRARRRIRPRIEIDVDAPHVVAIPGIRAVAGIHRPRTRRGWSATTYLALRTHRGIAGTVAVRDRGRRGQETRRNQCDDGTERNVPVSFSHSNPRSGHLRCQDPNLLFVQPSTGFAKERHLAVKYFQLNSSSPGSVSSASRLKIIIAPKYSAPTTISPSEIRLGTRASLGDTNVKIANATQTRAA